MIILEMFPCHKGSKASANNLHKYFFFLGYRVHITWHQQVVIAFKEIKRTHHLVQIMTPSMCEILLFCIFLLLTSSFNLSLEICFPEVCLVFYVISKIFSLLHFKDTHIKKAPSNQTGMLSNSMNMDIWVVGTSN